MASEPLQAQPDNITTQTRSLVQPERLAVTDTAIADLLASGVENSLLPAGAAAPAFSLQDATTGRTVHSDDLLALGPVVLNFFRGRWCPYCMTELEAWQALYPMLRERGALLVGISPQLQRQNAFTADQHRLSFPLLSDPGAQVAAQYGAAHTVPQTMREHYRSILVNIPFINGDASWRLPLPATVVIAPRRLEDGSIAGTVLHSEAYADHRVRPDPAAVLSLLSTLSL